MLKRKLVKVTPLIATLVFLLLGFIWDAWHPGWLVFLSIPLIGVFDKLISDNKKIRIQSIVSIVCVISFFILGFVWNAWHPGWLVFFAIPITSTLLYS